MPYLDVPDFSSRYDAIEFVTRMHLIYGYADGAFYADNHVTWGQACMIVARFLENGDLSDRILTPNFQINLGKWNNYWARDYIAYCIRFEVLNQAEALEKNYEQNIKLTEVYTLFSKCQKYKFHLAICKNYDINEIVDATRYDIAKLIYDICKDTGIVISTLVLSHNKNEEWQNSVELLFQYSICSQFLDSDIALIFNIINRHEGQDVICFEYMFRVLECKNCFPRKKDDGIIHH